MMFCCNVPVARITFFSARYNAQGFFPRPVRSNRRPSVAVYRTGLTENRWKPIKFKFKSTCVTGSDRYTDRFDRFTGPV